MNHVANIILIIAVTFCVYKVDYVINSSADEFKKRLETPIEVVQKSSKSPVAANEAKQKPTTITPSVEVGFARGGKDSSAETLILRLIRSARTEILVAAYAFTNSQIMSALIDASNRGVRVLVVLDEDQNCKGKGAARTLSGVGKLRAGGALVRSNGRYAIFHHKFMVIDALHVETGSFNYSEAATDRNAENVVLLLNNLEAARRFREEWKSLYDESKDEVCGAR